MRARGVWTVLLSLVCGAALLLVSGCRDQVRTGESSEHVEHPPGDASVGSPAAVAPTPFGGPFVAESVSVDGGAEGGPNCAAAGDPALGVDAGAGCTGALAARIFTYGICSCTTVAASGTLTTDAFNSSKGGPDGGAGGSVGANTGLSWSNTTSIGGNLWTPNTVSASAEGVVRGDLHLGGTLAASAPVTIDGNAFVVKTLPSNAKVLGTVSKVTSVAAPCDCTNLVPTASIVAAHRAPNNDDGTIGLSPTAAIGSNPVRIDLPCGNYYLSQISMSQPLTITAHGHTALYVDGNVNASAALVFQVDPTATLDLFVAGAFSASGTLTLGPQNSPAHCRAFIAGAALSLSASSTIGCNVYAPNAQVSLSGTATTAYGAIFAKGLSESGNATVHYDSNILNAGGECCTAGSCDDGNPCSVDACNGNGTCSHTPATNGTVCAGTNKCQQTYTCQSGSCTGSNPVTCTASDQCHAAGTCNPSTGACSNPAAANGTTCSDGNACTQTDTCQAGVCTGANPVACTASDQCHAAGSCNPSTGACSNPAAANGTTCSDGNACTQTDTCQAGVCTGANPVACTASDQCHAAGTCNPSTGACSNPAAANGTACSDGNACTQGDACQNGTCVGPTPVTCNAPGQCQTSGTCNPQTGCVYSFVADGTACTGTDRCNQEYQCSAGACVGFHPVVCTASDPCHTAGFCDPATGSCSNPAAADGTSCNDGNACTQSDACRGGTCTGTNPVPCTALDACHVAGTCNPSTGTCSNPGAPDGTSCGTGDGGTALVCMASTCAPQVPCTPSQTLCKGVCVGAQSDPMNCGACGNACAPGYSCAAGACVSPAIIHSCVQSGSSSVLIAGNLVTLYIPGSSRSDGLTGVHRTVLDGQTILSATSIPTPKDIIGCASNWVTSETVCISGGRDVYLIQDSTLTATLTDGANGSNVQSGGSFGTVGVTIDASTNKATLAVGTTVNGVSQGAFQVLDLTTNTFGPLVPAGTLPPGITPATPVGPGMPTAENPAFDPFRKLVLSPNEAGDYQLVTMAGTPTVYDNFQLPPDSINSGNGVAYTQTFDSAAEDCTTGIAVAADESASPKITLVDLTQAVFTPGSPNGTWTAPNSTQVFPYRQLFTAITVAPGSHLGLLAEADGPLASGTTPLIAFRLPSSAGSGTPALVDWAFLPNLKAPDGGPYPYGPLDPHPLISYISPSGRAMAVLPGALFQPYLFVLVDLQALLDAPRQPGTNAVDPSYDLIANGVTRFVAPCSQFNTQTDPANCGGCGNVCPAGAHATATCVRSTCRVACAPGFANCGLPPSSACTVNLETDPNHCGACDTSCAVPHSTGVCSSGTCKLTCSAGFSDCDGILSNGCETQGACAPLTASASGPSSVVVGASATYSATVNEPVPGRTLSYAWLVASGPGAVRFSAPDATTTSAVFSAPGSYVLRFEVSDGFGAAIADVAVQAAYVNLPPVVTAGPNQTLTAPGLTATLTASATDDGLPRGAALSATWSLVSGPVAVSIAAPTVSGVPEPGPLTSTTAVTFNYPGTYVFQFAVSDTNLVGTATQTVTINPPQASGGGTPAAPTVAIAGVTDDQEVTMPTAIAGTVSEGSWVLEQRLGGRDDVSTPWTVAASGTGAVSGALATFDPTLLRNGIYTLRLSATTSAGSTSTSASLSVHGRMKLGNFTLTFTDLSAAVGNLPLTVSRIYDSRDKDVGDFGVGWKLGISDVTVTKSGKTGAYWNQQFIDHVVFAQFCLSPSKASSVAITFPSGRQYRFVPQSFPQCQVDAAITTPDIGWVSTSDPNNPTIKLLAAGGTFVFARDVGNGVTQLQDSNANIWDPRQFTLTIEDGSVWDIDQDTGVSQVTDLNGNFVKVTPDGILHSSGTQVTFARDAQKRITAITDPAGKTMTYAYDTRDDLATYTDRQSNVTQFAYDDSHYLLQIQDPLGRLPVRNVYDTDGRLLSTTDAAGNTVHYSPNLAANQERVTDRLGHVTLYTYNDRGDVTQKVDPTGAVWNSTFDLRGNVLTQTDPLGHTKTSTYDGADDVLTQTDALGHVTTSTYGPYRQLFTTTDPLGHVTTNTVDARANVTSTTDPLGSVTRYTYDDQGNRLTEVGPLNAVTQSSYDSAGHVIQRIDSQGQMTTYQYDANGNKTRESSGITNYDGSHGTLTILYAYDALDHLLTTTEGGVGGPTRSTTYTASGKQATTTDEDGRVTRYAYDALDRLTTTTHPDGTTTSQSYDAENRLLSSTDEAGNTTGYLYDPVGRRIRTTFADGSSTSTAYDAAGNAIQSVDELGHVTWTAYDADGRLTSTTDPTGATTQTTYDAAGNTISSSDALGHTTSYAYDADNRVVATTYADGTAESTAYDAAGRTSARTDTLGRSTFYAYDSLGHLVQVHDSLGDVTQYAYDERGARTIQVDAKNRVTNFVYDWITGVQTARILPDRSTEYRAVDAVGQVIARTDFNGQTTSYTYDPRGRVLSRSYPDGRIVSFTYTPTGHRATATDARGTTSYAYDTRNRVVQMTYPDGRMLAMGYDADGNRTALTAKIGTQSWTTKTGYDVDHRPNRITDPLERSFAIAYDADGNRTQLQYPNTTTTSYAYDARNRTTGIATVQGTSTTPILSYAYTLDLAGRRTQLTEGDGTVRAYGYDGIDRLTSETVTGALSYAKTFAYDAVGNRLTQSTTGAGAGTVHYAYDARDRLTTENATTYAYDPNGNVTSKSGEATYTWDAENRLAAVNLPSGTVAAHQYDADGNRVQTSITPQAAAGTTGCLGNSAAFVREDSTTLGNWQGTYGADGYSINAEAPVAPAYGSVSFSNTNDFTWATNTDDKRALQQPPPQTSRIASTYYSFSGETVHVTTTDNNAHTVAFYMLNWDAPNRNQTITAQTPSGTVLDSARPFAWLSTGIYAVYRICGSVDFVFTPGGAPSAVVSGVFLGPSPGTPANTHMLVDTTGGLSQVVTETDGSGNLTAYYVRIGDELLEVMRPAAGGTWTTRFVHHDGLGSVRALSDETGTTVDTRGYEAFGTKNTEAGNDPLTDGFAGESFERTSQLAYHRARWMDARVGRFEGMDTKDGKTRHPATQHRYVYGLNEPTSVVDPTGNDGVDALPNYAAMVFGIGTAPGSGVNPPLLTPDSGIFEHYHVESNAAAVLQSALNQLAPSFLGYYSGHKVPHGYYATQVPSVSGVTVYLRYIFGQGGITVGNNVTLDRLTWGNIQTSQRYHLLAHELTHVLQYARLDSAIGFLSRYAVEYPSYGVPSELRAKPLSEIDPLDPNYSLDQLADTVADKVNPP